MSTIEQVPCPHCLKTIPRYKNPVPTVMLLSQGGRVFFLLSGKTNPMAGHCQAGLLTMEKPLKLPHGVSRWRKPVLRLGS